MVTVAAECFGRKILVEQVQQERREVRHDTLSWRNVGRLIRPALRPIGQVGAELIDARRRIGCDNNAAIDRLRS